MDIRFFAWDGPETAPKAAHAIRDGHPVVVAAQIDASGLCDAPLQETLCPDEQARAARFVAAHARDEFVAARRVLRTVLGAILGQDAATIALIAAPNHKPTLAPTTGTGLDFSLSHSGGWITCAFCSSGRIGVDLELATRDTRNDPMALARVVCTPGEIRYIDCLTIGEKRPAFLDLWRRKEALIKAAGLGFAGDPKSVAVLGDDGTALTVLRYKNAIWHMAVLEPSATPPIAVAVECVSPAA